MVLLGHQCVTLGHQHALLGVHHLVSCVTTLPYPQTLQPPRVAPNMQQMTIISEDTLEFGKMLGAGAFGTVHEVTRWAESCCGLVPGRV